MIHGSVRRRTGRLRPYKWCSIKRLTSCSGLPVHQVLYAAAQDVVDRAVRQFGDCILCQLIETRYSAIRLTRAKNWHVASLVSSLSLHILHLTSPSYLSIFTVMTLVLNAWYCVAVRNHSASFLRLPDYHAQLFQPATSRVCLRNCPRSGFIIHPLITVMRS